MEIMAKIIPLERFYLEIDFSDVAKLGEEKTEKFLDFLENLVFNTLELYSESFWDGLTVSDEKPTVLIDHRAMTAEQLENIIKRIANATKPLKIASRPLKMRFFVIHSIYILYKYTVVFC